MHGIFCISPWLLLQPSIIVVYLVYIKQDNYHGCIFFRFGWISRLRYLFICIARASLTLLGTLQKKEGNVTVNYGPGTMDIKFIEVCYCMSRVWNVPYNPRPPITGPVQFQPPPPHSKPSHFKPPNFRPLAISGPHTRPPFPYQNPHPRPTILSPDDQYEAPR